MTRAELEAVWGGQLVLMTRRGGLVDLSRRVVFIGDRGMVTSHNLALVREHGHWPLYRLRRDDVDYVVFCFAN